MIMKYLDEDILLTFSNLPTTAKDITYTYTLYCANKAVFVGSAFKTKTQTSMTVNVTQILQSIRY